MFDRESGKTPGSKIPAPRSILYGPGALPQLRVTNQPTGGVSRDIKFRHHPNPSVSSVHNNLAHLILRVVQTIRSHRMEFWKFLALDAKALVLREVPMKHIELDGGHGIEVALEHLGRLIVPGDVDQKTTPGKTRLILYPCGREVIYLAIALDQLEENLPGHVKRRRRLGLPGGPACH